MTRLVHLARHATHAEVGHRLSGRSDIALSAAGRDQAAALAMRMEGVPLTRIYSSPRRRAVETAGIVATQLGATVEVADALDEIDFGAWTGRRFDALDQDPAWSDWNTRRGTAVPPGGEAMAAVVTRARRFIEGVPESEVFCVSHCDVIRGVVADLLGLSLDRLLSFDCDPASLTTLELYSGGGRMVALNQSPWLRRQP